MNPDQPSREQIETRLTALLLGELPTEEAALLRYTIAQDPALQKLHDELQATLVLVPRPPNIRKRPPLKKRRRCSFPPTDAKNCWPISKRPGPPPRPTPCSG